MEKKVIIQKARDFAKRSLVGNIKNVNKEDYYMFLISKFLLLKETIIKKDSKNNILYFDYNKNQKYLPVIKYIVDYIKDNGKIVKNSTTVEIRPSQYNNSNLQFYIWTFNKIRDSFSHGIYEFDAVNNQIIINNDHSNDRDPYVLKCILPIEMLEFFTFIVTKPKNKYSETDKNEFEEYNKKIRDNFGYSFDYDEKIIKNYNTYNYINNKTYNVSNINDISYNLENKKYVNDFYNYDNKKINYNIKEYSKLQEDELEALLLIIKNSNKLTDEQRKVLYTYLKKLGLLDSNFEIDKLRIKRNKHPDKKYAEKLIIVINEISSILGIKTKANDMITIAAIYNYMQLTFSLGEIKFKTKEEKELLGYLKISKLHPEYGRVNDNKFSINEDSQYTKKVTDIRVYTLNFINKMQEKIQQYKNNPSSFFRKSINDFFKKYYEEIISIFSDKNAFVLNSIRNSIEHANVTDIRGFIFLNDQSNQNDDNSMNFRCYGKADDYFDIISTLETGVAKEKFTFDDFLSELKSIVDDSLFNDLLEIISKLRIMNVEALVSVLKQTASR